MEQISTILIVDDDTNTRSAMGALLAHEGYRLVFAKSGQEALKKAAEIQIDVVLLDIMMPDMNGYEVCRQLRASPFSAEVPVIMVTALDNRDARLQGIEAGADEFVSKPFDRVELRMRIRTIVRLNRYRQLLNERADLEKAYDDTLKGWSLALELRDNETQGHSQRVTQMTLTLARMMGIPEIEFPHVYRGALLHDIGKMGIPDSILHKPGPLTDEEWTIMRKHPVYAYELLSSIAYLRPALDIPYCHHEHWDGSGYPRGLHAENIPQSARIFAIVDVWDALRSDRPYRKAWSEERVRDHLQEQCEILFDPQVVAMFLTIEV